MFCHLGVLFFPPEFPKKTGTLPGCHGDLTHSADAVWPGSTLPFAADPRRAVNEAVGTGAVPGAAWWKQRFSVALLKVKKLPLVN